MNDEPSVLDFFKSLLTFWRGPILRIPPAEFETDSAHIEIDEFQGEEDLDLFIPDEGATDKARIDIPQEGGRDRARTSFPWRTLLALGFAIAAQFSLEPRPERTWMPGLILYFIAAVFLILAYVREEFKPAPIPPTIRSITLLDVRLFPLIIGVLFSLAAFVLFNGNRFTWLNTLLWISGIALVGFAFWVPASKGQSWFSKALQIRRNQNINFKISPQTIILIFVGLIAIIFRFYRLGQVPPEMVSDHAEKLLDIWDVLHGETSIFFPRNTGREAFQMYLTAGVIGILGTGYSFLSLKIGTVLCGVLTLPFVYLLGKEVANRRVGLIALFFAGIAYWPNVISRIALRFTLYPFFFAPALYFFLRGLRTANRNYFILAGIFVGLGLHGYSPFRIVPIVFIIMVGIYILHRQSVGYRKQTIIGLFLTGLIALLVFLPLLNYSLANPENFSYRTMTRLGTIEREFPGSPLFIFLDNLWDAMVMFAWDNGEVWVLSVTNRPALDVVSSALFYLGFGLLTIRYIRRRNWLDIFLLLLIPLLMLPSILSIAFPAENPSLNRTAAAIIPVFVIIGITLDGIISVIESKCPSQINRGFAWAVVFLLVIWAGYQNYDLVFNQYQQTYERSSWNSSEIGKTIKDFTDSIGSQDNAYVVAFPHWVDTRLVGITAGYPTRDFAIWPEAFEDTLNTPGAKLFLVKIDDSESLDALQNLYPNGVIQRHDSRVPEKDFYQFYVLPE